MTLRRSRRRGSALLETVMLSPILIMLLLGMTELARVGYTYYTLQKMMYTIARFAGTQQGVNFCDNGDAALVAAKNLGITGSTDGSAPVLIPGLSTDLISVSAERYDATSQTLGPCDCSATGCDAASGGLPPDFLVVNMPDGYQVRPLFFKLTVQPFPLHPSVRVPYGGT